MTFERLLSRIPIDSPSPLMKQLPTLIGFGLAVMLSFFPQVVTTMLPLYLFLALGLIVLATVLAAVLPWNRLGTRWAVIVPIVSMFAVGALRLATDASASPFVVLTLLPFVWIATEAGRINVLYAGAGTFLVLLEPLVVGDIPTNDGDIVRLVFSPSIYAIVALVVNEVAHRMRVHLAAARTAALEQEAALARAVKAQDELVLNEARLKTANRLIQSVWNAVTEQSVISDLNGLIDVWNPGAEKMLGLTEKQVIEGRRHIIEFHLASELESRLRDMDAQFIAVPSVDDFSALIDAVRAGYADIRDWTYVRADGRHVPVQVAATPLLDENGHRVGFIFVATDMTQACEFARLKDEFVGLISHELRTPLSSILGLSGADARRRRGAAVGQASAIPERRRAQRAPAAAARGGSAVHGAGRVRSLPHQPQGGRALGRRRSLGGVLRTGRGEREGGAPQRGLGF
nr:PAS domain-containing protein [Leifsonia xyli]